MNIDFRKAYELSHTFCFLGGMEEEGVSGSACFLLVDRELELLISPSDSEESGWGEQHNEDSNGNYIGPEQCIHAPITV